MKIWKRDIVEEAQYVMNANKSMANKNLISSMANEIVALRCEIERLETAGMKRTPIVPEDGRLEVFVNESGRLEARWKE